MDSLEKINELNAFIEKARGRLIKYSFSIDGIDEVEYDLHIDFDNELVANFFASALRGQVNIVAVMNTPAIGCAADIFSVDSNIAFQYTRVYRVSSTTHNSYTLLFSLQILQKELDALLYKVYSDEFDTELDNMLSEN